MKIVIETNGSGASTKVSFNGEEQKFHEMYITVRKDRSVKMQMQRIREDGKVEPLSFYGGDFEKFDEAEQLNKG